MKTLIIEDEKDSQDLLKHLLIEYCHDVEIIGVKPSVSEGVESFKKFKPQLVFLDIELCDGNGFDFLSQVDHSRSVVIIISGYDDYGIEAIKASAFDYFLKPYSIEDLSKAVNKARVHLETKSIFEKIHNVKTNNLVEVTDRKLMCKGTKGVKVIDVSEISHVTVYEPYCRIYMIDGSSIFFQITLTSLLEKLPDNFIKIHRSHALNIKEVLEWEGGRGGNVTMKNKQIIPIAYRLKKTFVHEMSTYLSSYRSQIH